VVEQYDVRTNARQFLAEAALEMTKKMRLRVSTIPPKPF